MDKTQEIVLPSADWERIQSLLNQPKPKVYTRQELVDMNAQREFGRARKRLMKPLAQKPSLVEKQKQANEEYWDRLVAEEAEFKEQERQQTIERSNFMRLLQDDRARQFNSVLQVIQVTKENEVLVKINRTRQRIEEEKRQKKEISREHEEALRQEQRQKQENASQRRLAKQALDAFNLQQVKEKQQLRKKEIQLEKQSFKELHTEQPRDKQEPKLRCLKSTLEDIANKKLHREMEARKLEEEEKEIMHVHCDIEQKLQQRKNDQAEKFRKHQIAVQTVSDNLAALKKKQEAAATAASEMALSKALAKKEAKLAKEQKQKEEQRAAMLKSISAHREAVIQEKEQRVKAERESRRSQESDRLFLERQKQKAQRIRENNMMVRRINETIVEEKLRHEEQLKVEEYEAELKNIAQTAERMQRTTGQTVSLLAESCCPDVLRLNL
uniref:Trichohyalin-plectin-homology domain-containing protein n=1 Tax=Monopterus albus TaxID=43700 RepID=A0A3Q3JAP0_MONAL